jgi:hypothetical protein
MSTESEISMKDISEQFKKTIDLMSKDSDNEFALRQMIIQLLLGNAIKWNDAIKQEYLNNMKKFHNKIKLSIALYKQYEQFVRDKQIDKSSNLNVASAILKNIDNLRNSTLINIDLFNQASDILRNQYNISVDIPALSFPMYGRGDSPTLTDEEVTQAILEQLGISVAKEDNVKKEATIQTSTKKKTPTKKTVTKKKTPTKKTTAKKKTTTKKTATKKKTPTKKTAAKKKQTGGGGLDKLDDDLNSFIRKTEYTDQDIFK